VEPCGDPCVNELVIKKKSNFFKNVFASVSLPKEHNGRTTGGFCHPIRSFIPSEADDLIHRFKISYTRLLDMQQLY
jgi:hypothetical protein